MELIEVTNKKQLKEFIYLPQKIHKNHTQWIHPIYSEEWNFFNPKTNNSFSYCDSIMYLAYEGKKPVGRIMGVINPKHNLLKNLNNARFGYLESYNNPAIAQLLLEGVEKWAFNKGINKIVGPMGFSDKDPQGFMIEGYDEEPVIATYYNFEYIHSLLEKAGYTKEIDLVSYKLPVPKELPELQKKICERILRNGNYTLHEFTTRKQLKEWIIPVFYLLNETYTEIYGFSPLSDDEIQETAKKYLPVIDPHFIKVVTVKDSIEPIAFALSMPEISRGIQKAKGKIFPFGFIHILKQAKLTSLLTMLLGAIRQDFRGKGLDTLMGMKIIESANNKQLKYIDSHLVLEINNNMRAEYERANGTIHKKFRIYQKVIN